MTDGLLGCFIVQYSIQWLTFQRSLLPPSSGRCSKTLVSIYQTTRFSIPEEAILISILFLGLKQASSMEDSPSWEGDSQSAVKKFPTFCKTRSFIVVFTSTSHYILTWDTSFIVVFTSTSHYILTWATRFIVVFTSTSHYILTWDTSFTVVFTSTSHYILTWDTSFIVVLASTSHYILT
jgi:hypothetical protein